MKDGSDMVNNENAENINNYIYIIIFQEFKKGNS